MRRIQITPEVIEAVCKAIIDSPKYFDVAAYIGVSEDTYKHWVKEGKELVRKHYEDETEPDNEHECNLIELHNQSQLAHRRFRQRHIGLIQKAGEVPKHWQAAKWILEQNYPEDFAIKPEDVAKDKIIVPMIIINTAKEITQETIQNKNIQVNVITQKELEDKRVKVQNVDDAVEEVKAELTEVPEAD